MIGTDLFLYGGKGFNDLWKFDLENVQWDKGAGAVSERMKTSSTLEVNTNENAIQ
jgi:hypothetical protein